MLYLYKCTAHRIRRQRTPQHPNSMKRRTNVKKNRIRLSFSSITSRVLLTCTLDSLILIFIILYILAGTFMDLERDLTEKKISSDLFFFEDAVTGCSEDDWHIVEECLYKGDTLISTTDPGTISLLTKIEENTGSACGILLRTRNGRYLTAALSPGIPRSYDAIQLLTSDRVLEMIEKNGEYTGTAEYGGLRVCIVYRMIYDENGVPMGCIFAGKDMSELKEHASMEVRKILLLILAAVAVSITALLLIAFRWTRSADAITDYMKRIGRGERPKTGIELPSGSGLEGVASGITDMVESMRKKESMDAELGMASEIQMRMLPDSDSLPDSETIRVRAMMTPAREVGGDFYDYFMVDEDRLAVVIADVSGKGMPAAMIMSIAKTLIKNYIITGTSLSETFRNVNRMLCEGNTMNYFVTAWAGILDTSSGKLTFVNAGHNPPFIVRNASVCEKLAVRPGFVLGGLDSVRYKESSTELSAGDRLFLYTDGVTEAESASSMYGTERLSAFLRENRETDAEGLLELLSSALADFRGEMDQSDDITALVLDYAGPGEPDPNERVFPAEETLLPEVNAFVESVLEESGCSPKILMQMMICVEEIFINIARYAYPSGEGRIRVSARTEEGIFTLRFQDRGIPFDPVSKEDPDVNAPLEERTPGGLGIYMVKQYTDSAEYEYRDGKNILTLKKNLMN